MSETYLRLPEVQKISGLSVSSIWKLEKKGKFPQRIKIGERAVGWLSSEIQDWVQRARQATQSH